MPRYDYRCRSCDCTFEVSHAAGAAVDQACPECGAGSRRVFTPVGVVFKGSGFHNTDYRPKPAETSSADSAPAPSPGSSLPCTSDCSKCPAAEK